MRRILSMAVVALMSFGLAETAQITQAAASARQGAASSGRRPVLEAFWGGSPSADQLPWEMINTISYFFASPANGHCSTPSKQQLADLRSLDAIKRTRPGLTVLVSVGGWGAPGYSADAATAASRRAFVASCITNWMKSLPAGLVNGFDVDWEFPVSGGLPSIGSSPADKRNLDLLLREFRKQLRRYALRHQLPTQRMKLSIDIPAGRIQDDGTGTAGAPYNPAHSYDLRTVGRLVDIFNLMTYDLCTGYSTVSCFNDPMVRRPGDPNNRYNNDAGALRYMKNHGVPARKIVLGVPFYGRYFHVTSSANKGLYQPYDATATLNYTDIIGPDWAGNPDFQQGWDPIVKSPYLWNPKTDTWVSYENPRSILIRSVFAKSHGLAGMMMWQVGLDDPQHSLLAAMSGPWLGD